MRVGDSESDGMSRHSSCCRFGNIPQVICHCKKYSNLAASSFQVEQNFEMSSEPSRPRGMYVIVGLYTPVNCSSEEIKRLYPYQPS